MPRQYQADWLDYMDAYRVYDPKHLQQTVAYVDEEERRTDERLADCYHQGEKEMAKIKIICTEQERREFEQHACPDRFNADWYSYFDCANPRNCSDCWAQYVDWETEEGEANGY